MKKYTLIRDKKLLYYLLIYTLLFFVALILSLTAQANSSLNQTYSTIFIIFCIVFVILYVTLLNYFIAKDLLVRFEICDQYITYGTIGWGEIRYDKIDSIYFDKDIVLIKKNKKKKLRVFKLDKNKENYIEILTKIKENTELDFSLEEAMQKLEYYNNYEYRQEGKPLRLNGWIFVLFMQIVLTSVASVFMLMVNALNAVLLNTTTISTVNPITTFIILVLGIATIIFIVKKHRLAPKAIIAFYLTQLIIGIINPILMSSYDVSRLPYTIAYLTAQVLFILIVFRYLNIFKRVSYTFIYDKFQTVEKAEKANDPGFKLFANEPSSLYGIFTWLLGLALAIISIIISIITLIIIIIHLTYDANLYKNLYYANIFPNKSTEEFMSGHNIYCLYNP